MRYMTQQAESGNSAPITALVIETTVTICAKELKCTASLPFGSQEPVNHLKEVDSEKEASGGSSSSTKDLSFFSNGYFKRVCFCSDASTRAMVTHQVASYRNEHLHLVLVKIQPFHWGGSEATNLLWTVDTSGILRRSHVACRSGITQNGCHGVGANKN